VDDYGDKLQLFICPSTATAAVGPSAFIYGEGSELASRMQIDDLPDNPRKAADGEEDLTYYWVQFDYQYMGRNIQETLPPGGDDPDGAPFEITKLGRNTHTGTGDDVNPPIMCDQAWYQPSTGYHYNHGSRWSIPSFYPATTLNPWSTGTASAHQGDVRINVLYRDGHVEQKSPDLHSYMTSGDMYFFR
jgi:hypothetical protein